MEIGTHCERGLQYVPVCYFVCMEAIKIEPVGGAPDAHTSYGTMPDTDSEFSISDFYAFVKQLGKIFRPTPFIFPQYHRGASLPSVLCFGWGLIPIGINLYQLK